MVKERGRGKVEGKEKGRGNGRKMERGWGNGRKMERGWGWRPPLKTLLWKVRGCKQNEP